MVPLTALVFVTKGFTQPVADALGRLVSNQINQVAASNQLKILEKSKGRYSLNKKGEIITNQKLVFKILQDAAYEEDEDMQDLWAGLLASSVDDTNLHHIDTLRGLTKAQALLITEFCKKVKVEKSPLGIIQTHDRLFLGKNELTQICGLSDIDQLDQALDDLRRKELIDGGFDIDALDPNSKATINLTSLALHFYARVMGYSNTSEFYKLKSQ
jgi:hypothetical protein